MDGSCAVAACRTILRVIIDSDVFDRKAGRGGTDHSLAPRQCCNNDVVAGRKWTQPPLHIVCGGETKRGIPHGLLQVKATRLGAGTLVLLITVFCLHSELFPASNTPWAFYIILTSCLTTSLLHIHPEACSEI